MNGSNVPKEPEQHLNDARLMCNRSSNTQPNDLRPIFDPERSNKLENLSKFLMIKLLAVIHISYFLYIVNIFQVLMYCPA